MMKNVDTLMLDMLREDVRSSFAFDLSANDFIYMNKALQRFLSALSIPVSFNNLLNVVHHEDRSFVVEKFRGLKPGYFYKDIKFRILLTGQKQLWVRLNLYLSTDQLTPILTGYFEDISAYMGELSRLNEYADRKAAVMNIIAHDLAGPLGNIQMFSDFIADKVVGLQDQELHDLATTISQISKQSISLIRDYVDGEFMNSIKGELALFKIDIVEALQNVIREHQQSKQNRELTFNFTASINELFAAVDKPKLIQAVNNILSNAAKFTPDGGEITIDITKKANTVLIAIKDTGIGIPKKYHANLFDRFNTARRPGLKGQPSVGLGMFIVKTIIDWHKGKLWFNSEENFGTTFYIELNTGT